MRAYAYYAPFLKRSYRARPRARHLYEEAERLRDEEAHVVVYLPDKRVFMEFGHQQVQISQADFREMRRALFRYRKNFYGNDEFVFKDKADELFYCLKHGLLES